MAHAYKGPRVLATTGLGGRGPSGEGQSYGTWWGLLGNPPGRPRIPAPESLCTEGMTQRLSSPPHLASPLTEGPPTAQTPQGPGAWGWALPALHPHCRSRRVSTGGGTSARSGVPRGALRGVQAGLLPLGASDSNLGPLSPGRALLDLPPTQALVPPGSAGYSWFLLAVAPPWRDTSSLAPPMQVREEASWGAVGPDSLSAE